MVNLLMIREKVWVVIMLKVMVIVFMRVTGLKMKRMERVT
jgi:hypothetical protein